MRRPAQRNDGQFLKESLEKDVNTQEHASASDALGDSRTDDLVSSEKPAPDPTSETTEPDSAELDSPELDSPELNSPEPEPPEPDPDSPAAQASEPDPAEP